jgi:hypothetical protein
VIRYHYHGGADSTLPRSDKIAYRPAIASVMPSHPLLAAITSFASHFAIDAMPHRDWPFFIDVAVPTAGKRQGIDRVSKASRHNSRWQLFRSINGLFEHRASRYYGAFRRLKLQQGFSLCSLLNAFLRAYRA